MKCKYLIILQLLLFSSGIKAGLSEEATDSIQAHIISTGNQSDSVQTPADDSEQPQSKSYVDVIADWYEHNMNYLTISTLMTIESSFIPFPSEIVVPPAAAVSAKEGSKLNIYLIVLFATLGAILGALINYFLSLTLGRSIIYRFADSKIGRLCMLNSEKIKKAEDYFNDHGRISTFFGRLIPGIRQLISIPAGLARMPLLPFILYTALGAGIWNAVLAAIGYVVGDNMDLVNKYSHEIGYAIVGIITVVIFFYVAKYYLKKKKCQKS